VASQPAGFHVAQPVASQPTAPTITTVQLTQTQPVKVVVIIIFLIHPLLKIGILSNLREKRVGKERPIPQRRWETLLMEAESEVVIITLLD
jgi:hypothetical protein